MTSAVVTVTPNPSVDRTLEVERLVPGAVQRAVASRVDAGGKGVNVARALTTNAVPACAVLPLGGPDGALLAALLADAGIPHRAVRVAADTRSNVTVAAADGTVTKVNAPGEQLPASAYAELLDAACDEAVASQAGWIVGCGSLPAGAPEWFYADLVERAHAVGVRAAVDTVGTPLACAVAAGADLVKPNLAELAEVVGHRLDTVGDAVRAAEQLRAHGAGTVVVSLGADGALLVDGGEPVHAVPPAVTPRSDVGAGDTLLAGFLAAGARGADALRQGVGWSAAAVALPGTAVPGPDIDVSAVRLHTARGATRLGRPPAA